MTAEEAKSCVKLQREYRQKFGESLVFSVVGNEERSIIEVLKECLRTGKPYRGPEAPDDSII